MTIYLDKKYVSLISNSLEKFKWKKINLANCRCPLCGDSEINKNKARGYFFSKNDAYFYKCHNCGISMNMYKFLEIVSPVLFQQYCVERFTEKDNKDETPTKQTKEKITSKVSNYNYINVNRLSEDHKAIQFLNKRMIPKNKWDRFYFTEKFGTFAKQINSDYNLIEEDRIIIPIYDEHNQMIGAQGRAFGNIQPKYITLKKHEDTKLIYGLNTIDKSKPILIVEGPIDSLFLTNSIACLGIGNFLEIRKIFQNQDLIFVVDNEPRSRSVTNVMKKLIENGEKICIFPSSIKDKDINDMVLNGIDVCDIIVKSIYCGPSALMAFNAWRKCI